MAKLTKGGVTFSNSKAAVADSFNIDDSHAAQLLDLNLLSGDPGSASLFSIGSTATGTTLMPSSTSGNIAVPTDLTTQMSAGQSITTTSGATVKILDGSHVSYDSSTSTWGSIDTWSATTHHADSFYYAIKMADGTVSWNTVTLNLSGSYANINMSASTANYAVLEDQHSNTGSSLGGGLVDDGQGHLTDGTFAITTTAASGHATSFSLTAATGDWGALSLASGNSANGSATYTYSVSDAYVYAHSTAGYGEVAHTDSFTITTLNGTTTTFSEVINGNISAADLSASASSASVAELGSDALNIAATDHDDNANLTYTITGVPSGSTLSSVNDASGVHFDGTTYTIDAGALGDLTFNPGSESEGSVTLHVTVTNTEGSGSDTATLSTSSDIHITVHDQAPGFSVDAALSGTAQEGATLHASATGTEAGWTVSYAWYSDADGYTASIGSGADYTAAEGDEGHHLKAIATVTNDDSLTATSSATTAGTVADQAPGFSVDAALSGPHATPQEGDLLTASATGTEAGWSVTYQWQQDGQNIANATGTTYTVAEGDVGHTIDVVATVHNDNGLTNTSTSTATATVVDETPTATGGDAGTTKNSASFPLTGTLTGSDSDNNDFTFALDGTNGGAAHGTVAIINATTGAFTYTPDGDGFVGTDSFKFYTVDGGNHSTDGTESVTLTAPIDDTISAQNGSFSVAANHSYTGTLPAPSGDSDHDATFTTGTFATQHGSVTISDSAGDFTYTPTANYIGSDSFNFMINDEAASVQGGESITVQDAPNVAGDDVWVVTTSTKITIPVAWILDSAHVTDPGGQPLYVTGLTGLPGGATANYDGSGDLTSITVTSWGQQTNTLTYTVSDVAGATTGIHTATGHVDVDGISQPSGGQPANLGSIGTVNGVNYDNYDYAYISLGTGSTTVADGGGTTYVLSSKGVNTFDPGTGADTFIYQNMNWSQTTLNNQGVGTTSTDTIGNATNHFISGDQIDLSAISGASGLSIQGAATTSVNADSIAWQAQSGDLWLFANFGSAAAAIHSTSIGGSTYYYAGTGGAQGTDNNVMEIHLVGVTSLSDTNASHPDFVLANGFV